MGIKEELKEFAESKQMHVNATITPAEAGLEVECDVSANRDGLFALIGNLFDVMQQQYGGEQLSNFVAHTLVRKNLKREKDD